jgi:hypothetical protein
MRRVTCGGEPARRLCGGRNSGAAVAAPRFYWPFLGLRRDTPALTSQEIRLGMAPSRRADHANALPPRRSASPTASNRSQVARPPFFLRPSARAIRQVAKWDIRGA